VCCSLAPSLGFNPMPPRTTQKSCRPRVSHRILVGTFSQRLACVASQPNGVEHHCFMKPSSWDKQLGLASPLKCAAIQSGQTNNPSRNETGLDASHHIHVSPEGRGKIFFLTSSLIGRLGDPFQAVTNWSTFQLTECEFCTGCCESGVEDSRLRLCSIGSGGKSCLSGSWGAIRISKSGMAALWPVIAP